MIGENQGEYGEAVKFYNKSIKTNQKMLSLTHPDLIAP
jgi:hypothetical protein